VGIVWPCFRPSRPDKILRNVLIGKIPCIDVPLANIPLACHRYMVLIGLLDMAL